MTRWYNTAGDYGDTALASFVRLTRNLEGVPFPVRLNVNQKNAVNERICRAAAQIGRFRAVRPDRLAAYEAVSLAERNVITPEFAAAADGALLLTDETQELSLMLCDGDHVRLLAARPGLDPAGAYKIAAACDDALDARLRFAFDAKLGYLNQDPMDIGTGMKAAVLMHLPALSRSGTAVYLASTAAKLGVSVKGAFGDGITVRGDVYRISNTLTMGLSEAQALENLQALCLQLATRERDAAERQLGEPGAQERIRKAVAQLSGAAQLSANEMTDLLSAVRMGAVYGLLKFDIAVINELMATLQPAGVNCIAGQKLPRNERDALRAKLVREKLFA